MQWHRQMDGGVAEDSCTERCNSKLRACGAQALEIYYAVLSIAHKNEIIFCGLYRDEQDSWLRSWLTRGNTSTNGLDKKNATPKPHKVRKRVFLAIFWKRRFSLRGNWLHVEDMNAALTCHLSGPLLYMVPTVFSKARDFEKFWKKK